MATTNSNASNHAPGPGQNTVTPPRPNNPSAPAKANSSDVGKGGSAAFGKKERKQDKTLGVDIANRMKRRTFPAPLTPSRVRVADQGTMYIRQEGLNLDAPP